MHEKRDHIHVGMDQLTSTEIYVPIHGMYAEIQVCNNFC